MMEKLRRSSDITKRFLELWDAAFDYSVENVRHSLSGYAGGMAQFWQERRYVSVDFEEYKNTLIAIIHGEITNEFKKLIEAWIK